MNEENKVEIKPGQFAVKGDKKRKVLAVNGGMVTLYNSETNTEFESKVSSLLSSGYVLMDETDIPERGKEVSGVAASSVASSTLTVPAVNNPGGVHQGATEPDLFGATEGNAPVETAPVTADAFAGQRRVRTPDEIMEDLKRRQEEDRAKMDLRYKEKIFKASQRLKSLPQKRSDALAMLDGLRQSIRGSTGNPFMTDDEADSFIHKAVENAVSVQPSHLQTASHLCHPHAFMERVNHGSTASEAGLLA